MTQFVKAHATQNRVIYLLSLFVVAVLVGVWISFFGGAPASANVTNVVGADNDTQGPGVDGRDFSISWTPNTEPAGYEALEVYLLSASTTLTAGTLDTACTNTGGQCQPMVFFGQNQYQTSNFTLPPFQNGDSDGLAFSDSTNYVAWVYVSSTNPVLVSSSPFSVTNDIVADTEAPFLEHRPVNITHDSGNTIIHAFIFDQFTTSGAFTNQNSPASAMIVYTDSSNPGTMGTSSAVNVVGDLFSFTVPSAFTGGAPVWNYYITANDNDANATIFCSNPGATGTNTCVGLNAVPNSFGTSRSISGNVSSNGSPLANAQVFISGYGTAAVQTDGSGDFTLSNLPDTVTVDLTAYEQGYCPAFRTVTLNGTNATGINLNLQPGPCIFDPNGASTPRVTFSDPPENMSNFPPDRTLRVGFSAGLNANTVNDADASDQSSPIYLTTDDGTTRVAGRVTYCADNNAAGCSSLPAQDQNVVIFEPTSNLSNNTQYTLVISETVLSENGQAIEGNRQGGGHRIVFSVGGGTFAQNDINNNFGQNGQYMPPFVRSMAPGPGQDRPPNTDIILEFDDRLSSNSVNTTNFQLFNLGTNQQVNLTSVSLDSTEQRFVTIDPGTLAAAEYEMRVLGGVANANGVTMRPAQNANDVAFRMNFRVSGGLDSTPPTLFPFVADSGTIEVNSRIRFGFNEQMNLSTLNSTNVQLKRGNTTVAAKVVYDPGSNEVSIIPNTVLSPISAYSVVFGTGVQDLAGVALASQQTFNYSTGLADTVPAQIVEARCDDWVCGVTFNEPMNSSASVDGAQQFSQSVLNHLNVVLSVNSGPDLVVTGTIMRWEGEHNLLLMEGLDLFTNVGQNAVGQPFTLTLVDPGAQDLSGNGVETTNNLNVISGTVESSQNTFGAFGGGQGMFGPPTGGGGGANPGGEFHAQGFGNYTAEQHAFGNANMGFPFNNMVSQDVGVFQVRINPGVVLQSNDVVRITFPEGMGFNTPVLDAQSPFLADINEFGPGTVTISATSSNPTNRTIDATVSVSGGTPTANDTYTIDLRGLRNPPIPKDPSTGGYTIGLKLLRGGQVLGNLTTVPFFTSQAGTNDIDITVWANSDTTPDNVDGTVKLFIGGPRGMLDQTITMSNGQGNINIPSLADGCYNIATEPFVSVGGNDYFGQHAPELKCVQNGSSEAADIILQGASSLTAVTTTIQLSGVSNFGGADLDIFAGGPGRFVVRTLSNVTTPNPGGYELSLPMDGEWFVGIGPAMSEGRGATAQLPEALAGVPPPPIQLNVSGLGTASSSVAQAGTAPNGVSFDANNNIVTFTFATADKAITGTITDDQGNGLENMEVFAVQQGLGTPIFTQTNASGTFTMNVANIGSYEIGAFKDGLPSVFRHIEVRADGADAGTDPDIFFEGSQITGLNPLTIAVRKPAYTISGKVLDANDNPVSHAPVFAKESTTGEFVVSMTDSSGSYTTFVDAGTWVLRSEMPVDKSDVCGTFQTTVTVTTESKANQNISPSASTCYTISGNVQVDGNDLVNVPLMVEEWNTTTGQPVTAGAMRHASTDNDGDYAVQVSGSATYRVSTWHPDYGEIANTVVVGTSNASLNLSYTTANVAFVFTGGTSAMSAFVELKNSTDASIRIGEPHDGLDANVTIPVENGETYDYFVDVLGYGEFNGTVAAGNTTTIDVSTDAFLTVTGTVYDGNGGALAGAQVTFINTSTDVMESALTDSNGQYTVNIRADSSNTYQVQASLAGYVPGEGAVNKSFTTDTQHNIGGGAAHQQALDAADQTIAGTVNDSGSSPVEDGFVWAENDDTGVIVTAAINADGTYVLPVVDGDWTVSAAVSQLNDGSIEDPITVSGSGATGQNLSLEANSGRTPESTSGVVAANVGGTLNDVDDTGVKLTVGSGVLETGSGNVTLNLGRNFTAPDTETTEVLGNAVFEITATGNSSIKNLNGNAEVEIDYTDIVSTLPDGVTEDDLQCLYYSPERGDYVPVEGGCVIDADNNTVAFAVNHFTDFTIGYNPPSEGGGGGQQQQNNNNNNNNGGGGSSSGNPFLSSSGNNPPTVASGTTAMQINAGAAQTATRTVQISFVGVTGAATVALSNTSEFPPESSFVAFTSSTTWELTEGDGLKRVYAKLKSSDGGETRVNATITLTGQGFEQAEEPEDFDIPCSINKGAAYKTAASPAVYYITKQCKKRAFTKPTVFFTWFAGWDDVLITSAETLAAIPDDGLGFMPWGPQYDPRYGALVKTVNDPKVYLLLGDTRQWITSENVFNALKYSWGWIEDVAEGLLTKYKTGSEIMNTDQHPNYSIIKYKGSNKVYRLEPEAEGSTTTVKRHIKSIDVFRRERYRDDRIIEVEDTETYADGPAIE